MGAVGQSYADWVMEIQRSGNSAHLVVFDSHDPSDRYEWDAKVTADAFTADTGGPSAGWCSEKGGRVEFTSQDHLSGRFSSDGTTLTAAEDISLQLKSGETVSFHFDWTAARHQ